MAHDQILTLDDAFQQVGTGFGSFLLVVMTGMIFCADAAELGYIAYVVQPLEREWQLSPKEVVFMEQAVFIGQILGPLFWGLMADRYGRRPSILGCAGTVLSFGLLSAVTQTYLQLLLTRAGVGFGVSGLFLCVDILCELVPKGSSGQLCTTLNYFWPFGSIFTLFCAWATLEHFGWRALTICAALPIALAFCLALLFLPESPGWLLEQGRVDEARSSLEGLARLNGVRASFAQLETRQPVESGHSASWDGHRWKVLPLAGIWFLFCVNYYGSILLGPKLFTKGAASGEMVGEDALDFLPLGLSASSELLSVTASLLLLDRWGRRRFQFAMYIVGGVAAFAIGFRQLPYAAMVVAVFMTRGATFAGSCGF